MLIEKALEQVNQGRFQQVCNAYLSLEYAGALQSPGAVIGKEKTRKGKPDAFLLQENGKYILGEYTTKDKSDPKAFFEKLRSDLQGCLEFDELGITSDDVNSIVLCCNSLVDPTQIEDLKKLTEPFQIPLLVAGIHTLANHLLLKGRVAARELLDIPFDSGQMLSKAEFVRQYQRKNLSTPLDTELVGREIILPELVDQLENNSVLIVKGPAGIGKTRLVLQAIDAFLQTNPNFYPFYILHKADTITEDLIALLDPDKHYVLLVDDANRQLNNFIQTLNKQIELDRGRIRIVATVRDYAKNEVLEAVGSMSNALFSLGRLENERIAELVRTIYPCVKDGKILDRIVGMSKGNPRLALMAGKAVSENPDVNLLKDASSIYDAYFEPILQHNDLFKTNKAAMKVMGLVAFFYSMDLEAERDKLILQQFGIPYDVFVDTVHQLHALEFLEIYDGYAVKVSDQTMATYFFYTVFIKAKLLSFTILINNYSEGAYWKMRDSFHAAFDCFGPEKVLARVKLDLLAFCDSLKSDYGRSVQFFDVFGKYFPEQTFGMIMDRVHAIQTSIDQEACLRQYDSAKGYYDHEAILKLLEIHYSSSDAYWLQVAIGTSFQYVFKNSHLYDTFLRKLREGLRLNMDESDPLFRQGVVYEWLLNKRSDGIIYQHSFYSIFGQLLLGYNFDNSFYEFVNNKPQLLPAVQTWREKCWNQVIVDYAYSIRWCYGLLLNYLDNEGYYSDILLTIDRPFIVRLIREKMTPDQFGDVYFVRHYAALMEHREMADADILSLKQQFDTDENKLFAVLAVDPLDDRRLRNGFPDHDAMMAYKEQRINNTFSITFIEQYKILYSQLLPLIDFEYSKRYTLSWSQDVLMGAIGDRDLKLAYEVITFYLTKGNLLKVVPNRLFQPFFRAGVDWSRKLLALLQQTSFEMQSLWLDRYFMCLPSDQATPDIIPALQQYYATAASGINLYYGWLDKFLPAEKRIYERVIRLFSDRRKSDPSFKYNLGYQFFEKTKHLRLPVLLCKQVYFQLEQMDRSFDNDSGEFFSLFKRDEAFLMEYVDFIRQETEGRFSMDYKPLSKIWAYGNAADHVYKVFQKLRGDSDRHMCQHLLASFFVCIDNKGIEAAVVLLQKIIDEYHEDVIVVNWVFDIARNHLKLHYHSLIQHFLQLNEGLEHFKRIQLLNNHFSSTGNVIWEDVKAEELRQIHVAVRAIPRPTNYFGHLNYLSECIDWEQRSANRTRRMRLLRLEF